MTEVVVWCNTSWEVDGAQPTALFYDTGTTKHHRQEQARQYRVEIY